MTIKSNFVLRCILTFILINVLLCCNSNNRNEKDIKSIVDNYLGQKLILPDSLRLYKPFSKVVTDRAEMAGAKFKIYTHIDVSCSVCVNSIKSWDSIAPQFFQFKTPFFLICGSNDDFEFMKYLFESKEIKSFPYPLFLDLNDQYIANNQFMNESSHFETVLTDDKDKILLLGNPIHSVKTREMYLNELNKIIN